VNFLNTYEHGAFFLTGPLCRRRKLANDLGHKEQICNRQIVLNDDFIVQTAVFAVRFLS
jgi:hypothetical protein